MLADILGEVIFLNIRFLPLGIGNFLVVLGLGLTLLEKLFKLIGDTSSNDFSLDDDSSSNDSSCNGDFSSDSFNETDSILPSDVF